MPLDAARRGARKRAFTPDPARRRDIAQEITDEIIALLESGETLPWRMPWKRSGGVLPLRFEGTPYRGINVFMLGLRAMSRGYSSPYWMSYRQALELGGQVRKGEKSSTVVYYGVSKKREGDAPAEAPGPTDTPDASDGEAAGMRRFLKWYPAFNADQIDGLPARYHPVEEDLDGGARPIAELAAIADAMIDGLGVDYREGGDRACYSRDLDRITMPEITRFDDAEKFYATKFHEAAHATEVPKRLNIDHGRKAFGNEAYARGELYAECTASLLGAMLGFQPDHLHDHAAYIQSWLKALRNDKTYLLKAAADAQRGADYLLAAAGLGGDQGACDTGNHEGAHA